MEKLKVLDYEINREIINDEDYICITDFTIIKNKNLRPADVIRNWLRNRNTLDFLATWEVLYNSDFKVFEFEHFKKQVGLLLFTPSVTEWIDKTSAKGLYVKRGKYGGTYAHKDIAFEFASAISPVFKLYLIKDYERLKMAEYNQLDWDLKRTLSKINYNIHTDAIKSNLIPKVVTKAQADLIYADEADVLNVALFGLTAKEWRDLNPNLEGNIRDYANVAELVCLVNLENLNSIYINKGINQKKRLIELNNLAIHQMKLLTSDHRVKHLENEKVKDLVENC